MRSATWRPPMPHHFHSSFFQSWPSTESDLRYSNVSGKMPFQNFSLPFHLSLLSSHFAFAGRPPPLQLVPPSTLTWQPQTPLSRRQWREPIYRWINPSNIFDLLVIYWPPTWITWITTFLQPISKFPQPDLLPDEQVICQADRVVTYSTGWDSHPLLYYFHALPGLFLWSHRIILMLSQD